MKPATLLIRADAGVSVGTGHVMRCLALAQAWQDAGGTAVFAAAALPPALEARLGGEGCGVRAVRAAAGSEEDARETGRLAAETGAAWAVVDGYSFDADYYAALKAGRTKVLAVDDYGHARRYHVDILLNQNVYADAALYDGRAPGARLLLGTRYVLLRREFNRYRGWKREIAPVARRILVTMGGSDPTGATLAALQAIRLLDPADLQVAVVVGAGNPRTEEIERAAREIGNRVRVLHAVEDMPGQMEWADVAIAAAGSTCWELAFMGLPCALIVAAPNQAPIAEALVARSFAISLDQPAGFETHRSAELLTALLGSSEVRAHAVAAGQQVVDGFGCGRVINAIAPG